MMANNLLDIKMETNIKSIWQGNTQDKGRKETSKYLIFISWTFWSDTEYSNV